MSFTEYEQNMINIKYIAVYRFQTRLIYILKTLNQLIFNNL